MARLSDSPEGNGNNTNESTKTTKERSVRKYGFACANCRKRKAKCDGGIPSCERCLSNGENCYFNKYVSSQYACDRYLLINVSFRVPSVTYALALQSRVEKCEALLEQMRVADDGDLRNLLDEHFSDTGAKSTKRKRGSTAAEPQQESPLTEVSSENELTEVLNETSVDEDGRICFYGTTSLYHLQPDQVSKSVGERRDSALGVANDLAPWERTFQWQDSLSLDTPSPSISTSAQTDIGTYLNVDVDSQLCNELLDIYWCWPHHLHLVLCRKIFMRMSLGYAKHTRLII